MHPASIGILFDADEDEWIEGKTPSAVLAHSFAAFWQDEFGTVHFLAVPDEWWRAYFSEHEGDDEMPLVVRRPDGYVEE